MAFSSPTEDIFPWVTPENEFSRKDSTSKRKCNSDSGYMSTGATPASGCKNVMLMTPDICSTSTGLIQPGVEQIYTPAMRLKTDCVKKRLLQEGKSLSLSNASETDSFDNSDLMDTSLYNEPMEISMIKPSPQLDMIVEENLDMCEISKGITVDLSTASFRSEPITPLRSALPCDRLYKTPSSLKSSLKSSKKKKVFLKKKLSKPGAMIGSDYIDFFTQLLVRGNFSLIACKILDLLAPSDLSSLTMVSKTWRGICLNYPPAYQKWMSYVADRKIMKENLPYSGCGGRKKDDSTPELSEVGVSSYGARLNREHYTPFRMKQPTSPPVSPSKFRFHLFQKEASRLKEDEKLTECPRCSLPSTVSPVTRLGRCTRAGCGLEFCSTCRSPYHGSRPCTTSTPASPQRPTPQRRIIGSKESKRFLRRL